MPEEISETYTEFADGVATGSNAWKCTSTHSFGNENTNALRNMECMGDAEMNEVESLASGILPASEVGSLDSSDKFSALTQAHLRDTGISNYHEARIVVFLDGNSDASTVIINSHDSMSTRVVRSCVKMVEVHIPQLLHAQMKMKIWSVILQNCTVAILDVNRSLLQGSQQFICTNLREGYEELVYCNLLYITFVTNL
jgi:hypothetical protein